MEAVKIKFLLSRVGSHTGCTDVCTVDRPLRLCPNEVCVQVAVTRACGYGY